MLKATDQSSTCVSRCCLQPCAPLSLPSSFQPDQRRQHGPGSQGNVDAQGNRCHQHQHRCLTKGRIQRPSPRSRLRTRPQAPIFTSVWFRVDAPPPRQPGARQSPARRQPHRLGTPTSSWPRTPTARQPIGTADRERAKIGPANGAGPRLAARPAPKPTHRDPAEAQENQFRRAGARRDWSGTPAFTSCHRSGSLERAAQSWQRRPSPPPPNSSRAAGKARQLRSPRRQPRDPARGCGRPTPANHRPPRLRPCLRLRNGRCASPHQEVVPRPDLRPRSRGGAVLR